MRRALVVSLLICSVGRPPAADSAPAAESTPAPAAAPSSPVPAAASVDELATEFESAASSSERRAVALATLKTLAAGEREAPSTREATFALARLLSRAPGVEGTEALMTAATLYPDDRRTPGLLRGLALAKLKAGEYYAAHVAFSRLNAPGQPPMDDETSVLAADNAVKVGDAAAAFVWSGTINLKTLPEPLRPRALLARLRSAEALGLIDQAGETARQLETSYPDDLHEDPAALLAAARAEAGRGRLESAAGLYNTFANIYSRASERPAALLSMARLLSRARQVEPARRAYHWLIDEHADSPAALQARLDLLDLDPTLKGRALVDGYLAIVRAATAAADVRLACDRLLQRCLGDGLPLEAVSVLGEMARSAQGVAALAARDSLAQGLKPALELIASRHDDIGLAAAAAEATALHLEIPVSEFDAVAEARRNLGLDAPPGDALQEATWKARDAARAGAWAEITPLLESPLEAPDAAESPARLEAMRLFAEALWRSGDETGALGRLDEALKGSRATPEVRALRVLRGDILYARGAARADRAAACTDYLAASLITTSPWVAEQMERCGASGVMNKRRKPAPAAVRVKRPISETPRVPAAPESPRVPAAPESPRAEGPEAPSAANPETPSAANPEAPSAEAPRAPSAEAPEIPSVPQDPAPAEPPS